MRARVCEIFGFTAPAEESVLCPRHLHGARFHQYALLLHAPGENTTPAARGVSSACFFLACCAYRACKEDASRTTRSLSTPQLTELLPAASASSSSAVFFVDVAHRLWRPLQSARQRPRPASTIARAAICGCLYIAYLVTIVAGRHAGLRWQAVGTAKAAGCASGAAAQQG